MNFQGKHEETYVLLTGADLDETFDLLDDMFANTDEDDEVDNE